MKFNNRTKPDRKKIIKLNADGSHSSESFNAEFLQADIEGNGETGTAITAEILRQGNWRDDKSLSYLSLASGEELPNSLTGKTQIVTKANGEVWVVPHTGSAFNIGSKTGAHYTHIYENNNNYNSFGSVMNALGITQDAVIGKTIKMIFHSSFGRSTVSYKVYQSSEIPNVYIATFHNLGGDWMLELFCKTGSPGNQVTTHYLSCPPFNLYAGFINDNDDVAHKVYVSIL